MSNDKTISDTDLLEAMLAASQQDAAQAQEGKS